MAQTHSSSAEPSAATLLEALETHAATGSGQPRRNGAETGVNRGRSQCVHQLISERAAQMPDAVALVFEDQQLTYRELEERSNQLARHLRDLGVGPEVRVGVGMTRSLEMMIGLLAVLKAGGAYVPVDPSYPRERVAFMLEDAGVRVLLSQQSLRDHFRFLNSNLRLVCADAADLRDSKFELQNPDSGVTPDHLAYVIYTSGSTGQPKGVMISHRNVVSFFAAMDAVIGAEPGVWLAITSISFDISVLELFWTLTRGFKVIIHDEGWSADNPSAPRHAGRRSIPDQIATHGVTHFQCTPSQASMLLQDSRALNALRCLKNLLLGGEALPPALANRLAGCGVLFNMYGPTETTIWSTAAGIEPDRGVTIGKPLANTQIYVVDGNLQPVTSGEMGELLIGGEGVARGYLNRPELTAQKFVPDRFSKRPDARLYRTGDLVRLRTDGQIEYLGRADHQVKLRGHRIELGEIETVLGEHPSVRQVVVTVREDVPGDQRLVAYVVPQTNADGEANSAAISQWQMIWDGTYQRPDTGPDSTFNIVGWKSSYTGQPIPAEEMQEWVQGAVDRIRALKPARVLEIGCGSGLLLFRLAPHCQCYCGTDFSLPTIRRLETILARQDSKLPVNLSRRPADDFSGWADGSFDAVVLNSVVQYFPDWEYLVRVLEGAARVVKPGGHIFVGDVRSLPLLHTLYASIETAQAPETLPGTELKQRVQRRASEEKELALAPEFFDTLRSRLPRLRHSEVLAKSGRHQNELTRFRYDVLLQTADSELTADRGRAPLVDAALAEFANRPALGFVSAQLPAQLRQFLKAKLPEAMVPSAFVILEQLPLTPNGKVDRGALPKPVARAPVTGTAFVPAQTDLEKTIAGIWQELLQVERVGLHDNFFDLGGHSLLLAQVPARLREALQVDLPLIKLFQHTTISALATFLREGAEESVSFEGIRNRAARQQSAFGRRGTQRTRSSRGQLSVVHLPKEDASAATPKQL